MPDHPARILLVGHCIPDAYAIRSAVTSMIRGSTVEFARDQAETLEKLPDSDLLLINRPLDGEFDADDGVALIRTLAPAAKPRLMLISNHADAQSAAQAAGALPGFGKHDLYSDETKRRLQAALA